jgi:hypothetical protein
MKKQMTDREALEEAMRIARLDPGRAEQLDEKLKDESWIDVAEFAASCVQSRALHLKPWELPPACIYEDDPDSPGKRLLNRMLDAGISQFHPDPISALEATGAVCATGYATEDGSFPLAGRPLSGVKRT